MEEEAIDSIRSSLENSEIVDVEVVESMAKERTKIYEDSIVLCRVFIKCYSYFKSSLSILKGENKKEMGEFLDSFKSHGRLRELNEEYGDGSWVGSQYVAGRIRMIIGNEREKYIKLVDFFFNIFGEE